VPQQIHDLWEKNQGKEGGLEKRGAVTGEKKNSFGPRKGNGPGAVFFSFAEGFGNREGKLGGMDHKRTFTS